jgi:hypothetical protein
MTQDEFKKLLNPCLSFFHIFYINSASSTLMASECTTQYWILLDIPKSLLKPFNRPMRSIKFWPINLVMLALLSPVCFQAYSHKAFHVTT